MCARHFLVRYFDEGVMVPVQIAPHGHPVRPYDSNAVPMKSSTLSAVTTGA